MAMMIVVTARRRARDSVCERVVQDGDDITKNGRAAVKD
jgi:hypothetical protein